MSRGRRIAINATFLSGAQVLAALGGVFVVGRVAAILTPEGYGQLEGMTSFVTLFTPIIFAGIQLILIRDICAKPETAARAVGDALIIRAALFPLFAGAILLFMPAQLRGFGWPLIILGIMNGFIVNYLQSYELIFEATERMWVIGLSTFSCYAAGLPVSYTAAVLGFGPAGVMGARVIGGLVQTGVLVIAMHLMFSAPKFEVDWARQAGHLRRGFPLMMSVALSFFLLEVSRATLASSRPTEEVGLYSSAAMISSKLILFVYLLTRALQPALCKTWLESKQSYADLLGRSLRLALIVTLPMGLGAVFVADDLIGLIFGHDFLAAAPAMVILMFALHLQFLETVLTASVVARNKENFVLIGAALAVGVNFLLSILFIPIHGYLVAALVTLVSQLVLVVFYLCVQYDIFRALLRQLKLGRVGLANLVLFGVCYLMRDLNGLLIIPVAMAVYAVMVLGLRCIDREEIRSVVGR